MFNLQRTKEKVKVNIIYVLFWDPEELKREKEVIKRYCRYPWARPILMTRQDATFENAFWPQLRECVAEWSHADRVGVIGSNAYKKMSLIRLNRLITSSASVPVTFFMDSVDRVYPAPVTNPHPHLAELLFNALRDLQLPPHSTIAYCNYWMATPALMSRFLEWEATICRPYLESRPFIWTDAKYKTSATPLACDRLVALWGNPFYPHYPFVMERLVKAFFQKAHPSKSA